MKRTNIFKLSPTKEQEQRLLELAENSARMFNEVNYKRRQSFFSKKFDWNTDEFYHKYKKIIGSATAQTVTRKNNEAWKSFFALLRLKKQEGKLPKHIRKVSPPGYWKDRKTGKRVLITLIRCDSYKLDKKYLKLPLKLKVRWKGKNRWEGKQGRLEIRYNDLSRRWYAYMPVKVEKPLHQSKGEKKKKAYIDLGIINIITSWIEGEKRAEIYSGRSVLSDWWYWNGKIGKYQSSIEKNGKRKTSRRLRRLFKKRQKKFRHVINTILARFVKNCWEKGVSEIIIGDVTNIRENSRKKKKGRKTNAMINNFWSFNYIYERLRITAENYGIKMKKKDEKFTSKTCSFCGKIHRNGRKNRGLYICKTHGVMMNADVNGVANIANPIFPKPYWRDRDNWLVAQPSVVKVNTTTIKLPTI